MARASLDRSHAALHVGGNVPYQTDGVLRLPDAVPADFWTAATSRGDASS
jgi:hypothetical protein